MKSPTIRPLSRGTPQLPDPLRLSTTRRVPCRKAPSGAHLSDGFGQDGSLLVRDQGELREGPADADNGPPVRDTRADFQDPNLGRGAPPDAQGGHVDSGEGAGGGGERGNAVPATGRVPGARPGHRRRVPPFRRGDVGVRVREVQQGAVPRGNSHTGAPGRSGPRTFLRCNGPGPGGSLADREWFLGEAALLRTEGDRRHLGDSEGSRRVLEEGIRRTTRQADHHRRRGCSVSAHLSRGHGGRVLHLDRALRARR